MGMGNAHIAVTTGDVVSYYNPAVVSSSERPSVSVSSGILSLDRILNFVGYAQPVRPNAGISAGIINSGASDIDGRDSDGEPTGPLRTSENEVFLGFSTRFSAGLNLGVNIKLLYHHLYTDVSTTTVGIDLGVLVPVGNDLTVGATVRDINSKYKWDTSELYGESGNSTEDKFPLLYGLGGAFKLPDSLGLVALDVELASHELSEKNSLTARAGLEVPLLRELSVRGGVDRIDLREKGKGIKPALGFTARKDLGAWTPAVNYAFVIEPFSSTAMHIISLSANF
jgi:hypothetical protein